MHKYKYIRTGPNNGWEMRKEIYAKCPLCGYYMSLDPNEDDRCPCGNMSKDNGAGRFGARTGDNSIKIYLDVGKPNKFNKCDCSIRYGLEISSLKQFNELNNFFETQCKNKLFKSIKVRKPFYVYKIFFRCYADKWYICRDCGCLWEVNYPDEKGGAWIRKFSEGKYHQQEHKIYNY